MCKYLFSMYMLTVVHVVRNYVLESTIDREVIEKYKFYNYVLEDATNSDREIYAWHVYSGMGFQNISTSDRMGTRIWKNAIRGKLKQTISTIFCQIFGIFDVSNMPKIWQICLTAI